MPRDWIAAIFLLAFSCAASGEDPWADAVVIYNAIDPNPGFDSPALTLGEPISAGVSAPSNSSIHSIGTPGASPGSYITLKFNTPITDDPLNPMGLDFIVYGNAFWVGGNPANKWIEAGLVEVSEDVNTNGIADDAWYVMPGSRNYSASVLPLGIANPSPSLAGFVSNSGVGGVESNWGYADLTPTQQKYLDNYVRPDDPMTVGLTSRSGGGDAFDIAWARDGTGQPANLTQIHFVRVSAFLQTPGGFIGDLTPEVDAVADVAPLVDVDGDSILDEYETRVAGTDPTRAESTVLALEIPTEEGGSPSGTTLGSAADNMGNTIRLISNGTRTGTREYNVIVDIADAHDPAPGIAIGGYRKSTAARVFTSTEADFQAAQIQSAEFVIAYSSGEVSQVDESTLAPFRYTGSSFSQSGISAVTVDSVANSVSFRSQFAGTFILVGTELPSAGNDLFVDFANTGAESGTEAAPWNTLTEAVADASDGDTLRLNGQSTITQSMETFTGVNAISKRLTLRADPGGIVRIGVAPSKIAEAHAKPVAAQPTMDESVNRPTRVDWVSAVRQRLAEAEEARRSRVWLDRVTYARTMPMRATDEDAVTISHDSTIAMRLRADTPVDARSLRMIGYPDAQFEMQPADAESRSDFWVVATPQPYWPADHPFAVGFEISDREHALSLTAISSTMPKQAVSLVDAASVPPMASGGVGQPLAIAPEAVFPEPVRITLPIPTHVSPDEVGLFFYQRAEADLGWYPAENVIGWVVPESIHIETGEGAHYIAFDARHAAIVQLGIRADVVR